MPTAQQQLGELIDFIKRESIVSIPPGAPVDVAPTPRFYRWTFASMWTPGPFEARPLRATYYITDVDPAWTAERQAEHLRDFNYGALWSISIHEVFPGHFLHYQHLRQVDSKLRKSILFSSTAMVEGWAHYCEQMMLDEGFRRERAGRAPRAARRSAHPPLPLHRRHPPALRGSVGGTGRPFLPRRGVTSKRAARAARRSAAPSIPSYILYSPGS